jgi:hypothetical protein
VKELVRQARRLVALPEPELEMTPEQALQVLSSRMRARPEPARERRRPSRRVSHRRGRWALIAPLVTGGERGERQFLPVTPGEAESED